MRSVIPSRFVLSVIITSMLVFNGPFAFAQDADEPPVAESVSSEPSDVTTTITESTDTAPTPPAEAAAKKVDDGIQAQINEAFGKVNEFLGFYMFYNVLNFFGNEQVDGKDSIGNLQLAVIWLVLGSIFFTIRMGFINVRAFKHAIFVTAGRYDNPDDAGEVSHFQALTSALSATVGLGNIAGVAIAIALGGPGATFWMIVAGFIGMTSKFVECTLGQKYREVRPDGRVMGGAMFYLSRGLAKMGLGPVGSFLGFAFAVLCIGGSFGGGCAFQVNQSLNAVAESIEFLKDDGNRWIYGAVMTVAVGIVIIGGIRSIARVAEKIVPMMCGVYVLSALAILVMNAALIPDAISSILAGAFSDEALYGGFIGVLVTGFKRAAFSNEAGVGSAAIAHAAAKTEYPVREGIVALLGPFIDTIVICTMTALVIVITGAYNNPDPLFEAARSSNQGATLTSLAMDSQIAGFRYVLAIAVTLFAYSTMISWSYYGERCWAYIFGDGSSMVYRVIFLAFVFMGSIVSATNVLEFGDLMILGMAFPNVIGVVFLSGEVAADLKVYWQKYTNGEFVEYNKSK
jgi:AGCS family alanine or glycine:cation symporter